MLKLAHEDSFRLVLHVRMFRLRVREQVIPVCCRDMESNRPVVCPFGGGANNTLTLEQHALDPPALMAAEVVDIGRLVRTAIRENLFNHDHLPLLFLCGSY